MSRTKKVIRNIVILLVLFFLFFKSSGLYLTALSAHEHSERSIHYGPSQVVHIEDFDGGKYILGKYDKWVSCNTVKRRLFFFWGFGNQATGFENEKTKAVDYTWSASGGNYKLYGIINNDRVKEIQIIFDNGHSLRKTEFYDDLFLFTWQTKESESFSFEEIRAYDSDNNMVFEEEY